MLQRMLRMPRGVEVGVAIPIGCMVPLAIAAAVLVGAGVLLGLQARSAISPDHVVVRVIDDGAAGGPKVVSDSGRAVVLPLSPRRCSYLAAELAPAHVRWRTG